MMQFVNYSNYELLQKILNNIFISEMNYQGVLNDSEDENNEDPAHKSVADSNMVIQSTYY